GPIAAADAGETDGGGAATDGVAAHAAAPAPKPAPPPAAKPVAPAKPRPQPNPEAAMMHAVAISQVRRGESALEQGRAGEALESFRAAIENEPNNAVAFRGMGMAYAVQGNDAQALQSYEKYLRLAPKAPDADEIRQSIRELKARAKQGASQP
ncbi:MAG: tetratricopeptide repeat protein, partial [Myxococcales bacterium]